MNTLFIHTNHKQLFGAKISKYSFEKEGGENRNFEVKFIIAEDLPEMQSFVGKTYLANGRLIHYTFDDLQSFTLTRFKAPELMGYSNKAIVIDPDIFALPKTRLDELFNIDMEGASVACVEEASGKRNTSLMLLDCSKLKEWRLSNILKNLSDKTLDKSKLFNLKDFSHVKSLPWYWNSLDKMEGAKILHTSNRLTQPWKTGLKIDFTPKPLPKLFGIIPREPFYKLVGKSPTRYLPHPDKKIERFFLSLVKDALNDGIITETELRDEIAKQNVRKDIFQQIQNL